MLDSKPTNHFRNLAWACLILTFVLFNTKDFWTDFIPPLQEKTNLGGLENSQEYKDALDLQKAFVRNAKKIKPSVVIIAAAKVGGIYANANYPAEFLIKKGYKVENLIEFPGH